MDSVTDSREEASVALVKNAFALMTSGDREGFYDLFSDNCEVIQPPSLPFGGVYRGKEAIRFAFTRVLECWDQVETHKLKFFASGEDVVVHMVAGGVGPDSGKSFWMEILELWRIRDGRIVEMRPFFFDTARLAEVK